MRAAPRPEAPTSPVPTTAVATASSPAGRFRTRSAAPAFARAPRPTPPPTAPPAPPLVDPPPIALDPLARRLVRRVTRAQRQIEEERLVGVRRADVDHALDGVVHQILGQMVAVGRREPERRVVGHQIGRELVGLAAEKAVVALEALAEGPAIAGGGGVLLVG